MRFRTKALGIFFVVDDKCNYSIYSIAVIDEARAACISICLFDGSQREWLVIEGILDEVTSSRS